MQSSETIRDDRIIFRGVSYVGSMRRFDDFTWGWAYQLAYREPNYPMPAIPTRIEYEGDGICLYERLPNGRATLAGYWSKLFPS